MIKLNKYILSVIIVITALASCGRKLTPEEQKYVKSIEEMRLKKNAEFMTDPASPFNNPKKVEFHPLNYFDVDPSFVFKSRLNYYEKEDTITIYGTKGEPRKTIRFAYLQIPLNGVNYKLNVYKNTSEIYGVYYSVWFTDKTTGGETYGVGRYLEFKLNPDPEFEYTIDFNLAYNPFCAYSPAYSCAIPSKDDYLGFEVRAGEKKFHD